LGQDLGTRTCSPTQQSRGKGGFGFSTYWHNNKALPPDGAEEVGHFWPPPNNHNEADFEPFF
jgi:hypothetical protein